jgi:hypothetical protein
VHQTTLDVYQYRASTTITAGANSPWPLESACEENLDDQITLVASCLDSVFAHGLE